MSRHVCEWASRGRVLKRKSRERTVASFFPQLYSVKCLSQLWRNSSCVLRSVLALPHQQRRAERRERRYILLRPPAGAPIHAHSHTSVRIPSSCSADVKTTYPRFRLWFLKQKARQLSEGGVETHDKRVFILPWEVLAAKNKCFPACHRRRGNKWEASTETVNHPKNKMIFISFIKNK